MVGFSLPPHLNGLFDSHSILNRYYGGIREAGLVEAAEWKRPLSRPMISVYLREERQHFLCLGRMYGEHRDETTLTTCNKNNARLEEIRLYSRCKLDIRLVGTFNTPVASAVI